MVKDDDGFHSKLKANLGDTYMRGYLVKRSLANIHGTEDNFDQPPDRMTHKEAANYLRMSPQTLYNKVHLGEISRRAGRLFLKEDLDAYLRRE